MELNELYGEDDTDPPCILVDLEEVLARITELRRHASWTPEELVYLRHIRSTLDDVVDNRLERDV
jgi:hypothetical protein